MAKEAKYQCPMHSDVVSDKPGKCPKCGGMDLVKGDEGKEMAMQHMDHDHSSMMASPEAAHDFLKRFFIVTFLLLPLFIFGWLEMPIFQFAVATIIFYFGLVFFEHAKHEMLMRKYGMMTLVSIAISAGYLFSVASTFLPQLDAGFYPEISTLIWILLFGHYLEAKSSTAAGDALSEVAKLLPKKARVIKGSTEENVAIESLQEDDIVRILAGEKVPADGKIIKGSANFNEAHISGESKPSKKGKGDMVIAGAICIDGSIDVKLMKVGENSTIGQIKKLISEAGKTKPSAQRLADRAASWLTLTAVSVSLITIGVWLFAIGSPFAFALTLAITVLVIACPHALGLAIPTVSTIATRLAVKNGLFIKDMAKLEVAKTANYVVFDKTGTLTKGEPEVVEFEFMEDLDSAVKSLNWKLAKGMIPENYIQSMILSLESESTHPIAASAVKYLKNTKAKRLEVIGVKNVAGKGIQAKVDGNKLAIGTRDFVISGKTMLCANLDPLTQAWSKKGQTVVYVSIENKHVASFSVADPIKAESQIAVDSLHELSLKVAMLTGDSKDVAEDVASRLGIDTYFAQVLPEDKYKHIKKLQDAGNIVVMVGDGVNDAPALTQANVGVAVGAGTEVAVEAGDVVLTSSNPQDVVSFIKLSRKVYSKMIQNLYWALGYNVLAIPAAAGLFIPFGFRLTPAIGAFLMSLSSVVVVINALSLRRVKL